MTQTQLRLTTIIGLLTLSGCGGGGGGGGGGVTAADATVAISPANAIAIIRSIDDVEDFAGGVVLGTLVGPVTATSLAVAADAPLRVSPTALNPQFCNGGAADVNEGGLTVRLNFNNCQDFMYTSPDLGTLSIAGLTNGSFEVTVLAIEGSTQDDFVADITLTNFSLATGGVLQAGNGTLRLDYMVTPQALSVLITSDASDLTEDSASRSVEDFRYFLTADSSGGSLTTSGGITSSDFDLLAYFDTQYSFDAGMPWPNAGRRLIFGADGQRIRVTPLADGLRAQVDLDLDGNQDFETSCIYNWEVLLGTDALTACAV